MRGVSGRGLSIGELVVATGLLALMLVTLLILFGQMLDSSTKNTMFSQGTFFAESILEGETARLTALQTGTSTTDTQWITVTDEATKTNFMYKVDSTEITDAGFVSPVGKTFAVQVEVRWWTSDMSGQAKIRQGYGKLYLKRERLVYVPNP